MLRVAAVTGGLFAIGAGVAHYFPGSWTEPVILAVLGATMLLLGRDAHAPGASRLSVSVPKPKAIPAAPRAAPAQPGARVTAVR